MIPDLLPHWELLPLFFLVALLYSSAGFGGGSSYLALMALWGIDFRAMRWIALGCNVVVVSGGTFWMMRHLRWKKVLPLVLTSIPMAFLGGKLELEKDQFLLLLSITLILASAVIFLAGKRLQAISKPWTNHAAINMLWGGGIGFLAGAVGIGGGIFLAPLLHLTSWDRPKVIAATSSFYILVNSIAGLAGQATVFPSTINWWFFAGALLAVFVGGQLGSRWLALRFQPEAVRKWTAIVVGLVGIRLLLL